MPRPYMMPLTADELDSLAWAAELEAQRDGREAAACIGRALAAERAGDRDVADEHEEDARIYARNSARLARLAASLDAAGQVARG